MASFNKVIIMGNLVAAPEMRVTPGGMSICKFTLAVNRQFTTKEGEQREEVAFIDVDSFGRSAEVISKYLSKGSPILVEGRLRLDKWETPQGEKRSKLMVVCETFKFVGGRESGSGESDNSDESYERSAPPPRQTKSTPTASDDGIDEDVPF
ncbi:single-stranded DNA-binding protein [Cerasicoccus arenae]|uniref:Single-stranded DNA-binding protein n=1 Tax=Cerasicoccus arenae TaxID=424488 RepID=A0A8J3DJ63_9BACT|nr:single-stranded DNA-binding protein [Cerasicoccus arenae]MBK1856722.1 single-stranded DNA-binding protein [Cerasicoccus arenae]GHB99132.1 single-stranded DNA-binding protein [Cerasicoccus arenae]